MVFDPPSKRHIAKLLCEYRRAHGFGPGLGDGETAGKGEAGPAYGEPEPDVAKGAEHPGRGENEREHHSHVRLVVESEIRDDPTGKEHRQPQEPAVLLGFERARDRGKAGSHDAALPHAARRAIPLCRFPPWRKARATGRASPALTRIRPLCYITKMSAVA